MTSEENGLDEALRKYEIGASPQSLSHLFSRRVIAYVAERFYTKADNRVTPRDITRWRYIIICLSDRLPASPYPVCEKAG